MVSFSELELSRKIGHGAAGSVWRGSWRGAAVAVKVRCKGGVWRACGDENTVLAVKAYRNACVADGEWLAARCSEGGSYEGG